MAKKRVSMLVCFLLLISSSSLHADGCFFWHRGGDLNAPSQKAVLYWKSGREKLLLQVKYEGPADDFALVVPLPSRPEVEAIDPYQSPFTELSLYTQLRGRWGYKGRARGLDASEEAVEVLERKTVGVYDVAVLAAHDAAALTDWLKKNGFSFPEDREDVLEYYTRKKWFYAAMRIDPKALQSDEVKALKTGELQPLLFTFAADELVYPLKISSINAGETMVLLYVLAGAPMVIKGEDLPREVPSEPNIPRQIQSMDPEYGTFRKVIRNELPLTWEALDLSPSEELSLCRYGMQFNTREITGDLVLVPFDPFSFWMRELVVGRDAARKQLALAVLSWHDPYLLRELIEEENEQSKVAIAANPKTPRRILKKLARDNESSVRTAVASNHAVPGEIARRLLHDRDRWVRDALAGNPYCPKEVLATLSDDEDLGIRFTVAKNPKASIELLRRMVEDAQLKGYLAHEPFLRKEMQAEFAKDSDPQVRRGLAENWGASMETLALLADDEDTYVRSGVAVNQNTPIEVLRKLSRDKEYGVRRALLYNRRTPDGILKALAEDENVYVRAALASNWYAPQGALRKLAKDESASVRKNVAENPQAPKDALFLLTMDGDKDVCTTAKEAYRKKVLREPGSSDE